MTLPIPKNNVLSAVDKENHPMRKRHSEVNAVYEKYRHLDELLSDADWLDMKDFRSRILYDLWSAIREESIPADVSGFENQRYGAAPSGNVHR